MRQWMDSAKLQGLNEDPLMGWDNFFDGILTLRHGYHGVEECVTSEGLQEFPKYDQDCLKLLTVICFLRV